MEPKLHPASGVDGTPSSQGHVPRGGWRFDESVARVFDDMLRRSIPEYESMRKIVERVGRELVRPGTDVVDLGCSRGDALAAFLDPSVRCVGVEVSAPMLEAARRRFEHELEAGLVDLRDLDLRHGYPAVRASLTLLVLTLQFTPVDDRPRILQAACDHTVDGGAVILVEKVKGESFSLDRTLVSLHEELKRQHGYTQEEIDRKRMSLAGALVPLTATQNEALLRQAGFSDVECIWRALNFAAWVGVKGLSGNPATSGGGA